MSCRLSELVLNCQDPEARHGSGAARVADHRGRANLPGHAPVAIKATRGPLGYSSREPIARDDPAGEALLVESVGVAMLVVLDTLSPAERVDCVLHDAFRPVR